MTQEIIDMAQECGLIGMRPHLDGIYSEALVTFAKLVAEAEREACAKVCEEWLGPTKDREIHIAAAIRARQSAHGEFYRGQA